jgi:hypothetical protein
LLWQYHFLFYHTIHTVRKSSHAEVNSM